MMGSRERVSEKRTSTVIEAAAEGERAPKRLRLILREPSALACLEDARKATKEDAKVAKLLELRDEYLRSLPGEQWLPLCLDLVAILSNSDPTQEHLLECASELLKEVLAMRAGDQESSWVEIRRSLLDAVSAAAKEDSARLSWLLPLAWLSTGPAREARASLALSAESMAATSLHWANRRSVLETLTATSLAETAEERLWQSSVELATRLSKDAEARVRAKAVACLALLSERRALPLSAYHVVPDHLRDEEEEVRLSALPLLTHFAAQYTEERVSQVHGRQALRLVDDAFSHLCHSMNDTSLAVRIEAAELLGCMEGVGNSFLEQTLDKKLMTKMRSQRTSRYGIGKHSRGSEWSTGKRLGHDAPAEKVEDDSSSLIPSGACGAFVTGLEDEFLGVRRACVRSLSRLASRVPAIAPKALEFLADMFNDEIAEVRLEAMESLGPLIRVGTLSEDQMEVMLGVLDDVSGDSRAALHDILALAALPTLSALSTCVSALLRNLQKYPSDKETIWRALVGLGGQHPSFLVTLAPKLLGLHPFFDIAEPPIDDAAYVAKLMLLLNAAPGNGALISLFPPHLWRHHLFLRHAYPHLVPAISETAVTEDGKPEKELDETAGGLAALRTLERRLALACSGSGEEEAALVRVLGKEAEELRSLGEAGAAGAALLSSLSRLRLRLALLARLPAWDRVTGPGVWKEAWTALVELDATFHGPGLKRLVGGLRLRLSLLALALAHKNSVHQFPLPTLLCNLQSVQEMADEEDAKLCEEAWALLEPLRGQKAGKRLELSDELRRGIRALLQEQPWSWPQDLCLNETTMLSGRLWRPSGEDTLRLTAGLSVAASVGGEVGGDRQDSRLVLLVAYPNERVERHRPRESDWHGQRLSTRLVLSASLWTHKAPVNVHLAVEGGRDDEEMLRAVDRAELSGSGLCLPLPSLFGRQDGLAIPLHPRAPR